MLDINWGDVINILNLCKPYLIALSIAVITMLIVVIAAKKANTVTRKLIRSEAGIALLMAAVIVINMICFGPMSTMISLVTGSGIITDSTIAETEASCESIAEEGIVLLKNDNNMLPLQDVENLNVFGWASTNPCYGGTGSGAISDAYEKVTLFQGLENAGFQLNTELSDFYTDYRAEHPEFGAFVQDWTLPEPPVDTYSETMLSNAKEFSDTALIVLSRTGAEHADLPTDVTTVDTIWPADSETFHASYENNSEEYEDFPKGTTFLELSQSERNMVEMVCENFENVVVIYNGSNALEMGVVNEYDQIKGAVWCAGPGQNGFNALGSVLRGTVNPSGKTSDIFAADYTQAPYINNIGKFTYDNMDEFEGDSWGDVTTPTFVNYVEGIYVGYKFYETAADEGLINYEESVVYPFGYGLSYTSFTQRMGELTETDGMISFDVTVTNTGKTAGKDVVEVFYNPPYRNGGIEKATANLIAFEKTVILEPGDSQTLSIAFQEEDMASFDSVHAGAYVLEAGDYNITINSDSHNEIAAQTYQVEDTITYTEGNERSTDKTASVTQLADSEGDITYLSRADGFANYEEATAAPSTYTLSDEYKEAFLYNGNYDPKEYNNEEDEMPVTGANNRRKLEDLRGADFNDESWEPLLDQLTISDMSNLIALGGYSTAEAPSVKKVSTIDCDGPASINNNFTGVGSIGFPSATMIACTWNKEKALEFGQGIGKMADEMGVSGWYAPAMNIHRSPFAGRNFEYYSEDGVLSGIMAANAVLGAKEYGVYAYIKHFALNDQEMNRQSMLCTWSNEQATREIYLKPFEIAVKAGDAQAVMSAYNYIGVTYAGAKSELLNNILREEWGFEGMVLTDYFGGFGYMDADQAIRNGGDTCLIAYDNGTNYVSDTESATSVLNMRRASKNILYTVVNSRAYDPENINAGLMAWQIIAIVVDVVLAAGIIALELFAVRKYRKRKDTSEITIESVSKE